MRNDIKERLCRGTKVSYLSCHRSTSSIFPHTRGRRKILHIVDIVSQLYMHHSEELFSGILFHRHKCVINVMNVTSKRSKPLLVILCSGIYKAQICSAYMLLKTANMSQVLGDVLPILTHAIGRYDPIWKWMHRVCSSFGQRPMAFSRLRLYKLSDAWE